MPPKPRPTSPRPAMAAAASASNSRDSPTSDSSVSLSTTPRQSYLDPPHGRSQLPSSSSSMTSRPASMSTSTREANLGRGLPSQVSQNCHTKRQRKHTVCGQAPAPAFLPSLYAAADPHLLHFSPPLSLLAPNHSDTRLDVVRLELEAQPIQRFWPVVGT